MVVMQRITTQAMADSGSFSEFFCLSQLARWDPVQAVCLSSLLFELRGSKEGCLFLTSFSFQWRDVGRKFPQESFPERLTRNSSAAVTTVDLQPKGAPFISQRPSCIRVAAPGRGCKRLKSKSFYATHQWDSDKMAKVSQCMGPVPLTWQLYRKMIYIPDCQWNCRQLSSIKHQSYCCKNAVFLQEVLHELRQPSSLTVIIMRVSGLKVVNRLCNSPLITVRLICSNLISILNFKEIILSFLWNKKNDLVVALIGVKRMRACWLIF